jgi:hypothetical protein
MLLLPGADLGLRLVRPVLLRLRQRLRQRRPRLLLQQLLALLLHQLQALLFRLLLRPLLRLGTLLGFRTLPGLLLLLCTAIVIRPRRAIGVCPGGSQAAEQHSHYCGDPIGCHSDTSLHHWPRRNHVLVLIALRLAARRNV